jgi:hypothetical protein
MENWKIKKLKQIEQEKRTINQSFYLWEALVHANVSVGAIDDLDGEGCVNLVLDRKSDRRHFCEMNHYPCGLEGDIHDETDPLANYVTNIRMCLDNKDAESFMEKELEGLDKFLVNNLNLTRTIPEPNWRSRYAPENTEGKFFVNYDTYTNPEEMRGGEDIYLTLPQVVDLTKRIVNLSQRL